MTRHPMEGLERPTISVVMANFEAGTKIVQALRSVQAQSLADIEIIVSDDGSRDDSLDHVRALMHADPRILLVEGPNRGPAACRNRALAHARGRWIAIVDSDDMIHPERLERLLAAAHHHGADIVADDLLLFFEDGTPPRLLLDDDVDSSFAVSAERWLLAGIDGAPALGYLKPLIRAEWLHARGYDEKLRIGEDHDLILKLLLDGARMHVISEPYYLYRRHSGSISHRLSSAIVADMLERQSALIASIGPADTSVAAAFEKRAVILAEGLDYEVLISSIKARRLTTAALMLAMRPRHLARLFRSFIEGRARRRTVPPRHLSPLLTLGEAGAEETTELVPPYVPVASTNWVAGQNRHVWRGLAARRGLGAVRCLPLDRAGLYAAGFIPEAEIAPLERAAGVR